MEPSILKRGLSYGIDLYIGALIGTIPISIISLKSLDEITQNIYLLSKSNAIIATLISLILLVVYYILIPVYLTDGSTIGKKITGIGVVYKNKKYGLVRQFIFMILFTSFTTILFQFISVLSGLYIGDIIKEIMMSISAVAIFGLLISKNKEGIHNKLGKTKLISITNDPIKRRLKHGTILR